MQTNAEQTGAEKTGIPDDVKYQLSFKAGQVFSPSSPISQKELFAGRTTQLSRVLDVVATKGQHGIMYGERGVGKTSLANILGQMLQMLGPKNRVISKVNCDSDDEFASAWIKALRRVQLIREEVVGFNTEKRQRVVSLAEQFEASKSITPENIRSLQDITSNPFVFIFDEFDRVGRPSTSRLFADTIKTLSDHGADITIILIGVADNVSELIKEHASIDRSLVQIPMPRMAAKELAGIIDSALAKLGMTTQHEAKHRIISLSQGLPHYTHLLGLASAREAINHGRLCVETTDLTRGIEAALDQAQQSIISSYNTAVSSPRKDTLFREVLLACALCPVDDIGYFAPSDVRTPLEKILGKTYEIPAFIRHLNDFSSKQRGQILTRIGEKRRSRFRFNNPLMQPYIVMRGIREDLWCGDVFGTS